MGDRRIKQGISHNPLAGPRMRSRALFPESITIVGATETLQQLSSRRSESVHFMRTIGFEDITFDFLILGEFRYLPSYKKAPPTPARQNI